MILVWFVYGLAFFTLGLVVLIYPKKGSGFDLARSIWMIGTFGILHGLNEWLDMFIDLGGPFPPELMAKARILTLFSSFFFLVQFGITILSINAKRRLLLRMTPFLLAGGWLALLLLTESSQRLLMGDIWARYLLCAPGTFLAAWGLACQIPRLKAVRLHSITINLATAAAAFFVYGVLAGVIVKKADFFPASILNYETFLSLTGLPVQTFRAVCAIIAAWSIIHVLGIFRWEAQDALRASELRCATIASALPVFLFMTDRNLGVTFVQGRGLDAFGLHPEQIRGKHIRDAFPGGESLAEHCQQALSGQEFIATALLNDVCLEVYYSALKDGTGVPTNVIGVALDISAKIQAQKELDGYRRELEKRAHDAAVGVLSTTMAQQVVEPLTVMQLVLERAVADPAGADATDTVRNGIAVSLSELSKARDTLKRFMEIVHPDAAAVEQPISLYQIAKRTMRVFADDAQHRRLTIAVKDMDIVPLMAVSAREVEQIFYHLIQRAVNAASGETEQRLVISCAAEERYVVLSFCDTCGRLQPKHGEHASNLVLDDLDAVSGSGLGLAVAKRIVEGHGGQITVDTAQNGTTTLRVRLPVTRIY